MTTELHGWPTIEEGDRFYDSTFDDLIDEIDTDALLKTEGLPDDHIENRWILDIEDRTVHFDDGSEFLEIRPERVLPDRIGARVDRDETIGAQWSFTEEIDADINGRAPWVTEAASVEITKNAETIAHFYPGDYCLKEDDISVEGEWTFTVKLSTQTVDIEDETLRLPRYG